MVGIYFSGTGNSKYVLDVFLRTYDVGAKAISIEDDYVIEEIILIKPSIIAAS